ncbi:hypothetical protein [Streptomyces sp. NPDC026673]|uniref:hypothetical protein n=1 Tax=Streptomyces sp. NPDC026673 TaxID=3155724 RepID=UPI0033D1BCC6
MLVGGFGFTGFAVVFTGFGWAAFAGVGRFEGAAPVLFSRFGFDFGFEAGSRRPLSASPSPRGGCVDVPGAVEEVTWTLDEPELRSAPGPSEPDC